MADESNYIFTRDFIDNNRINLGHYQFKELYGYLLHPSIPTDDADLRVADVATGTGIWLTDLSSRVAKTAQLDGFDVSFQATPPAGFLPSNITLRNWNIREPVPEDLVEKYDIVHVRYLCLVVSDEEIKDVLQNIVKLLKPGGYLQWGDQDSMSWRIEKSHPDNDVSALDRLYKIEDAEDKRFGCTWVPQLPSLFQESAGLQEVVSDVRDPPPHMAFAIHETMLMLHDLIVQTTKNEQIAKGLGELLPEVVKQGKQGACWAFTRWIVVGRKPVQ